MNHGVGALSAQTALGKVCLEWDNTKEIALCGLLFEHPIECFASSPISTLLIASVNFILRRQQR